MNKIYKDYLKSINIISEEEFNEVLEYMPNVDINVNNIIWSDYEHSQESLSRDIIDEILNKWNYVYVDDINWEEKTITLGDIDTVEDLDEIKNLFSKWTISNYDELKKEAEENTLSEKEQQEYDDLISVIRFKADLEQLRNFVESL